VSEPKRPALCTQCGACREVCLAEELGGHTITSFLSGGETFSSWLCSCCWLCQEVCPQGVDIHELMIEERRTSEVPDRYGQAFESVISCGYAFDMSKEINDLRASFQLHPLLLITPERLQVLLAGLGGKRDLNNEGGNGA